MNALSLKGAINTYGGYLKIGGFTMAVPKNVQTLKNYIGGQWIESTSKQVEDVPNPATGEIIARVPLSTRKDLDRAVTTAN